MYNTVKKAKNQLKKEAYMIKSMTGFGRGEHTIDDKIITVEMKSVNHRYLDVNIRMSRKLNFLENYIRNIVKNRLSRGKLDLYINYEDHSNKKEVIQYNENLAYEYMTYFDRISTQFDIENDIKVSHLSRYPDVLKLEEQDDDNEDLLKELLETAVNRAIDKMIIAREKEGALLKADLIDKLDLIIAGLESIKVYTPDIVKAYKEKLEIRIAELVDLPDLDQGRLAMEVAVFADKVCIDEEIVRLETHINHMKSTLDETQPIGRKLDFLTQEMNRESNTILSKANSIEVSDIGLEFKTEIEKIREQIQNIE